LTDRVFQFLADSWRQDPDRLRATTRLDEDPGMTADDADQFLQEFARRFEVDLGSLEF
jgi:hypothetical protein